MRLAGERVTQCRLTVDSGGERSRGRGLTKGVLHRHGEGHRVVEEEVLGCQVAVAAVGVDVLAGVVTREE